MWIRRGCCFQQEWAPSCTIHCPLPHVKLACDMCGGTWAQAVVCDTCVVTERGTAVRPSLRAQEEVGSLVSHCFSLLWKYARPVCDMKAVFHVLYHTYECFCLLFIWFFVWEGVSWPRLSSDLLCSPRWHWFQLPPGPPTCCNTRCLGWFMNKWIHEQMNLKILGRRPGRWQWGGCLL